MENLPVDVIRQASLELSPRDVLSLCLSKKSFAKAICNSDVFWRNKIIVDYPKQVYPLSLYKETPKKLYMMLTVNSKIIELDENGILKNEEYDISDIDALEIMAEKMTKFIGKNIIINGQLLKRGDVLHLSWGNNYRNDDKFLWDGEKVVLLDYENDDYGSVPKEFSFPEFPPEYFSDSISHNNIVRLSDEKVNEVLKNFNIETQTSFVTDRYNQYLVKIYTDISNVNIKFNKIIMLDYLDYDTEDKIFILNMDSLSSGGYGLKGKAVSIVTFTPEWKVSIISIIPKSPSTTYIWEEDTLEVTTFD